MPYPELELAERLAEIQAFIDATVKPNDVLSVEIFPEEAARFAELSIEEDSQVEMDIRESFVPGKLIYYQTRSQNIYYVVRMYKPFSQPLELAPHVTPETHWTVDSTYFMKLGTDKLDEFHNFLGK